MNFRSNEAVAQVLSTYEPTMRRRLQELRRLILRVAKSTKDVGPLEETLRWNQLSYLTSASKSGSLIRLDAIRSSPGKYALYFHCQTTLVSSFRRKHRNKLRYEGNRAVVFDLADALSVAIVEECVREALTYRLQQRGARTPIGSNIK